MLRSFPTSKQTNFTIKKSRIQIKVRLSESIDRYIIKVLLKYLMQSPEEAEETAQLLSQLDRYDYDSQVLDRRARNSPSKINSKAAKQPEILERSIENKPSCQIALRSVNFNRGLPNTGNRCFLNCIVQMLFGVTSIRDTLIDLADTRIEQNSFSIVLGRIMKLMESDQDRRQFHDKQRCLDNLIIHLEALHPDYRMNCQQDALSALLAVNQQLKATFRYIDKPFPLHIEYQSSCKCDSYKIESQVVSLGTNLCSDCGQIIKISLSNNPDYIIVLNTSQEKRPLLTVFQGVYFLKSVACYSGNKLSGHYFCQQIIDHDLWTYNDAVVVKQSQDKAKLHHEVLFMVYQKPQGLIKRERELSYSFNFDDMTHLLRWVDLDVDQSYKTQIRVIKSIKKNGQPSLKKQSLYFRIEDSIPYVVILNSKQIFHFKPIYLKGLLEEAARLQQPSQQDFVHQIELELQNQAQIVQQYDSQGRNYSMKQRLNYHHLNEPPKNYKFKKIIRSKDK